MRPIRFERSVHSAPWGSESWEISAFASDPSVIVGDAAGRTLRDVCPSFPLLFKVIDAHAPLSVQVHPNEVTCRTTGGDPKTEMWCALSDGPIYAGFRAGTTQADAEAAVRAGRIEDLLVRHEARAGDAYLIPGGLVHAIGGGVRLYEVQQSSNTTFRLYDWGRVGSDGRPRELHVEKGLAALDPSLPVPSPVRSVTTPYFDFTQTDVCGSRVLSCAPGEFLAVFAARGGADIGGVAVAEGASVLLPPGASCTATADGAHLLLTRFAAADGGLNW